MEQEFSYTIREDMGDHYEDIKTGTIFADSKMMATISLENQYGDNCIIVIK